MWTFPVLLFLCIATYFPTAWIIRAISPGFWAWSITKSNVLIAYPTTPEIETHVYIWSLCVAAVILFAVFQFVQAIHKKRYFLPFVSLFNCVFSLYFVIVPVRTIFELDLIQPIPFFVSMLCAIVMANFRGMIPVATEIFLGIALLRFAVNPLIELDLGHYRLYTLDNYLRYGVSRAILPLIIGILYIIARRLSAVHGVLARMSDRAVMLILLSVISLSLAYLMIKSAHPSDMFFTMLPAYHVRSGGTLLVSVMSQYGLLYLAPWLLWVVMFPQVPVSFQIGTVVSAVMLALYFVAYTRVVRTIVQSRMVWIATVIASFYFTIHVRYTPQSDMVSLVSTPAFTPLRFGVFIIPLWFLVRSVQTNSRTFFRMFIVTSSVLLFYSFEIGLGILVSALFISGLYARLSKDRQNAARESALLFAGAIGGSIVGLTVYTIVSARTLPDFTLYWHFAKLFGSGYLTVPMRSQVVAMIPLGFAVLGMFVGLSKIMKGNNPSGLIYCYLSCIQLAMIPYYTGRSMNQTLYSISLPFLLLGALFIENTARTLSRQPYRFSVWAFLMVCIAVIAIGTERGIVLQAKLAGNAQTVIGKARDYALHAFRTEPIKKTGQFAFLNKHLPAGCPLVSFDEKEFELMPALGVPPAFQYAFVYGFITTKEQVDMLIPRLGSDYICVFVSNRFIRKADWFSYGTYRYFESKYRKDMQLLSLDRTNGFALYAIPSRVFAASYVK